MKHFEEVVSYLEGLSIMPKEMPGIQKLLQALSETTWFSKIDPKKVIVVAGTNGKGSTCAILESLLISAGQRVGFYSSPHLIDTTERIRIQKTPIDYPEFIELFAENKFLIGKHQLTHFEALTLMCASYFFSEKWKQNLDFALFEVGLGGLYDATNAIPHATSVITALSLDHTNILGNELCSIAKNKFGIVKAGNTVVYHPLDSSLESLKQEVIQQTQSNWIESISLRVRKQPGPRYFVQSPWGEAEINLLGDRAVENAATALTVFDKLGFKPDEHLNSLTDVKWNGRMQKVKWPSMKAALYLSGDHNQQGIQSLLQILKDFTFQNLFLIVGIGKDKEADVMLQDLCTLPSMRLYLTETPFKGLRIDEYPEPYTAKATDKNADVSQLLDRISKVANENDLVLVTGSLYLVGDVLKKIRDLNGYDFRA